MNGPIKINVGATFEAEQVEAIRSLNEEFEGKTEIVEVYGSMGRYPSARSFDRVPQEDTDKLFSYVSSLADVGVQLKWTLNQSCIGSIDEFDWNYYKPLVANLKSMGVHRYIVTVPLIIELLLEEDPDAYIEVSTINRVRTAREVQAFHQLGARAICLDVNQNRNRRAINDVVTAAHSYGMIVEAIVNEFCLYMCIHRNVCYNLSSHNSSREAYSGYPFSRCIMARDLNPIEWIRARFILPQDMKLYRDSCGIDKFKMTGRTHPTEENIRVLRHYMSQTNPDNLLDLWHHINVLVKDPHDPAQDLFIPCKVLEEENFTSEFLDHGEYCDFNKCDESCFWCQKVYEQTQDRTRWPKEMFNGEQHK